MRLDKYLCLAKVGTRKKVRQYIYEGDVLVNGQVVQIPAAEINEQIDFVSYKGNEITNIKSICYMFNKPQGCITAKSDEIHKTIFDYFTDVDTAGLFAVGRLDRDTEGLILITNDGELNHRLMDPRHHVDKTYYFWVFGMIDEDGIKAIEQGVDIGDKRESEITKPGKIEILTTGLYTDLKGKMEQDGCDVVKCNLHKQEVTSGYITISEGKKHQVKRMMRSIGCYVVYLKRVSIGNLKLNEGLKKGEFCEVNLVDF